MAPRLMSANFQTETMARTKSRSWIVKTQLDMAGFTAYVVKHENRTPVILPVTLRVQHDTKRTPDHTRMIG